MHEVYRKMPSKLQVMEEELQHMADQMRLNPNLVFDGVFAQKLVALCKKVKLYQSKQQLWFITVNPVEAVTTAGFKLLVEKFMDRKISTGKSVWAYEQRSVVPGAYHGIHCHILMEKDPMMSPAQMRQRAYNTFKHCVGHEKAVDVRVYPMQFWEEKLDYLKGLKWDEDKVDSVNVTKQWRRDKDLCDFYEK